MQNKGQMSKMGEQWMPDDQANFGRAELVSGLSSASFEVRGTFLHTQRNISPASYLEFVIQVSEFVFRVTFSFTVP